MNQVELTCARCEKLFFKNKKEYERQSCKGRSRFFCSLSCGTYYQNLGNNEWTQEIEMKCVKCEKNFQKQRREFNRCQKNKQKNFFCSKSCQVSFSNKENPRPENLRKGSTPDEFSKLRWFILRTNQRATTIRVNNIDLQYLKELWERQNGVCPFTGWKLFLPVNSGGFRSKNPANASIDRINNELGYIKGNIRFISLMANLARSTFSDDELIKFGKAISEVYDPTPHKSTDE